MTNPKLKCIYFITGASGVGKTTLVNSLKQKYKIILVDCDEETMSFRLNHKRKQPELLTQDMKNWLRYLRNQAEEFKAPVINTTKISEKKVVEEFEKLADLN